MADIKTDSLNSFQRQVFNHGWTQINTDFASRRGAASQRNQNSENKENPSALISVDQRLKIAFSWHIWRPLAVNPAFSPVQRQLDLRSV